jgi:asparagine synthetase B (glutamine-hydrolysing)
MKEHIIRLMHPNNTVMDLSISAAFWFASRGIGYFNGTHYTSTARILLSGLGADELFGGYSRHRNAFLNGRCKETPNSSVSNEVDASGFKNPLDKCFIGLLDQLQWDLDHLPTRNLGRDCRVISSLSKEVRWPFLAHPVVSFSCTIPVHWKCDLRNEIGRGVGEKVWLRLLARQLGFDRVAVEKKRAVQFGARTAKIESRLEHGDDMVLLR